MGFRGRLTEHVRERMAAEGLDQVLGANDAGGYPVVQRVRAVTENGEPFTEVTSVIDDNGTELTLKIALNNTVAMIAASLLDETSDQVRRALPDITIEPSPLEQRATVLSEMLRQGRITHVAAVPREVTEAWEPAPMTMSELARRARMIIEHPPTLPVNAGTQALAAAELDREQRDQLRAAGFTQVGPDAFVAPSIDDPAPYLDALADAGYAPPEEDS